MQKNIRQILFFTLCIFAIINTGYGINLAIKNITWLIKGSETEGILSNIIQKVDTDNDGIEHLYYYGVYTYTVDSNKQYNVKTDIGLGNENSIPKKKKIYYDPKFPSESVVADPAHIYTVPFIFIAVGIGVGFLAYIIRPNSKNKFVNSFFKHIDMS